MAYEDNVFVNCPFDSDYDSLFYSILFAVHDCGFVARSALEIDDAGEARIEKIYGLIRESKFAIHDISRTQLDANGLPRFNMPLELGIFLGARKYGDARQRQKRCLILDHDRYRFQKYCSDIAGQDIRAHESDPSKSVTRVRDWLVQWIPSPKVTVPGGGVIARRYSRFLADLPAMCEEQMLDFADLPYIDKHKMMIGWLKENLN